MRTKDKTKEGKAKASVTNTGRKKTYVAKTKVGTNVEVKKSFVDAAKSSGGVFKPTSYKGKILKDSKGQVSGFKSNSGKIHKSTSRGPKTSHTMNEMRAADYRKYEAHETKRRTMKKRVAKAKPKGS